MISPPHFTHLFAQAAAPEVAAGWLARLEKILMDYAVPIGGKIVGAIVLWIIGRVAIRAVQRVFGKAYEKRKLDPTLIRYLDSVVGVLLNLLLLIVILSLFGVETTSFAGVLAAGGVRFTAAGPVLDVRPSGHNDHYWDVYLATNQAIVEEFSGAGYPVPAENRVVRSEDRAIVSKAA